MITYRDMTFCADRDCATETCPRHHAHVPDDPPMPVAWCDFNEHQTCPAFTNGNLHKRKNPA